MKRLEYLKKKALRKGVWFRVLSRIERSIYDLALRTVSTIRSAKLLKVIGAIMDKLKKALENPIDGLVRTVGWHLAAKIAHTAYSWGHPEALSWVSDYRFAKYLALCYMNLPKYYKEQHLTIKT